MKQLSVALIMYTDDYQGVYPGYVQESLGEGTTPGDALIWSGMIQPYVKNKDVFACPSAGKFEESYGETWDKRGWQSIGMNINMGKWIDPGVYPNYSPLRLIESAIKYPAKNLILADSINGNINLGYKGYIVSNWDFYSTCGRPTSLNAIGRSFSNRHFNTTNIAFADGHSKNVNSKSLLPNTNGVNGDCRCVADANPSKLKWAVTVDCESDDQ